MKAYIIYRNVLTLDGSRFQVGGIETYILGLCEVLLEMKIQPIIVQCAHANFKKIIEGIEYRGIKHSGGKKYSKYLYNSIKNDLDSQDLMIWGSDEISFKISHKRTIAIQHGIAFDYYPEENRLKNGLKKYGLGHVFKYLQRKRSLNNFINTKYKVCVDYNFWNWYRTFSIPEEDDNIFVIPNFTKIDETNKKKRNDTLIKVVFARRFVRKRGVEIFIEVVNQLKHIENIHFTFAGEGPYKEQIQKLVDESNNVFLTRYSPDESIGFHSNFDIAVVPTIGSEGTSLSLLEAMSAGNAVICTAVGGMTNIILNEFNGLIIKPNSVKELKASILRLVEDEELRIKIAENAKETVKEAFSFELWKKSWKKVFNEVVNDNAEKS